VEEHQPGWLDVPLDEHLRRGRRLAVPAVAAGGCLLVGIRFGWSWQALPFLYFVPLLAALAVVDLHTHRLPNALTLPSYPLGLLLVGGTALARGEPATLLNGLGAALLLLVVFLLLAMGMGDVKAAGVVGLFVGTLGVGAAIVAAFLGALLAFAGGAVLIVTGRVARTTPTPFGPWLAAGSLVAVLAGPALFAGYLAVLR
jgi:leader peptidase (prepilin peptidase)/N-methyltransferase